MTKVFNSSGLAQGQASYRLRLVIRVQVLELKNTDQGLVEKEKMNNFVARLIKKLDWRHTECNTTNYNPANGMRIFAELKRNNYQK